MGKYYDGSRLLSMQDVEGNRPEIFLCTSNRSAGKTTFFNRYLLNRFVKNREKFMLLYRFEYELDDVAGKFFKDIGPLFFQGHDMCSKSRSKGAYQELFFDGVSCGYAVSINGAEKVKKLSHLFSDTVRILMDEFQSETNRYAPAEIDKFQSIHTSVARGHNKQVRYVPVIMLSNAVSILNPYYNALGIADRLRDDTKFLRGIGWVLEQGFNENASEAQKSSAFNRAFSGSSYSVYAAQNVYLSDNKAFIERLSGENRYICTVRYGEQDYSLREYQNAGVIYASLDADKTYPTRIAVTTDDHNTNFVLLNRYAPFIDNLRYLFDRGCFRFQNLKAKEAILKLLSY